MFPLQSRNTNIHTHTLAPTIITPTKPPRMMKYSLNRHIPVLLFTETWTGQGEWLFVKTRLRPSPPLYPEKWRRSHSENVTQTYFEPHADQCCNDPRLIRACVSTGKGSSGSKGRKCSHLDVNTDLSWLVLRGLHASAICLLNMLTEKCCSL